MQRNNGSGEVYRHLRQELGGISLHQLAQIVLRWHLALETLLRLLLLQQNPIGVSPSTLPTTATEFMGLSISICIAKLSLMDTQPRERIKFKLREMSKLPISL